jgi:hypothetical protein
MTELKAWLARQFEDRLVEPKCPFGNGEKLLIASR